MNDEDTGIGGPGGAFPATLQSVVLGARSEDPAERQRSFQALVAAYWKPVYKTIRLGWKRSNEDAKDLTQGFFARAMEKDFFTSYDPARARFRTFLRVCAPKAHRETALEKVGRFAAKNRALLLIVVAYLVARVLVAIVGGR